MKFINYILAQAILVGLFSSLSFAEIKKTEIINQRELGFLLGDPIALSLKVPIKEKTFLNVHAGLWSWHFWNGDLVYDTPYLSLDYARLFYHKRLRRQYYIGAGLAAFFKDNPKDDDDYDTALAVRIPLGIDIYKYKELTLGFEIAPIYQFAPAYSSGPYGIELNGGFIFNYAF